MISIICLCVVYDYCKRNVYSNMMSIINELPYDIISNFINNETFIDYVMYDAPYTKKKFNELREKYSFKIID